MSYGVGIGRLRFGPLGVRLLAFWLLAMTLFAVGWWWRPAGLRASSASTSNSTSTAQAQNPASGTLKQRIFERDDSWAAMRAALDQRRAHPDDALYAPVLARCLKFQYPPSSLLSLDALHALVGPRAVSDL